MSLPFTFTSSDRIRAAAVPAQILRSGLTAFVVFLALWVTPDARGLEIEKLVMPGPVISGHAKFEADCRGCHAAFAKTRQNTLCLDCHEDIARDLHGKGFTDITMATGHGPEKFSHIPWLKVTGKEPPWS